MHTLIEKSRRLAELGAVEQAQKGYRVALSQSLTPEERMEAACFLLQSGDDYQLPYRTFVALYREGQFCQEVLSILTEAFYLPNIKKLKTQYERNCARLAAYPYVFGRPDGDFPAFDELKVKFLPFDDQGYFPFDAQTQQLGEYTDFRHPEITHYFFKDLENPIFATDIFSQYELEYLNDCVRPSEWVARDNHIYLHYTDWNEFCSYLQVINLRPLLEDKKFVFLIGDQGRAHYPIDFKAEYGIDYSTCDVQPIGIREVNRMIWHTQLGTHNGGDFFNEILFGHPNILSYGSLFLHEMVEEIEAILGVIAQGRQQGHVEIEIRGQADKGYEMELFHQLIRMQSPTMKDVLVTKFLSYNAINRHLDRASRIAPVLLFQPHFPNITYKLKGNQDGVQLHSEQYDKICNSPIFKDFKYIKTFTPMRRRTVSYGAAVKFVLTYQDKDESSTAVSISASSASSSVSDAQDKRDPHAPKIMGDGVCNMLLNRSFMVDPENRLFTDSRLVRFEDGKLNPTATFTALAEFLDLPYTESMTYCSGVSGKNPLSLDGNAVGFDPSRIFAKYDEYANDAERCFIEYFLRDAYEYYGYDFEYYDGKPKSTEELEEWAHNFTTLDGYMRELWDKYYAYRYKKKHKIPQDDALTEEQQAEVDEQVEKYMDWVQEHRSAVIEAFSHKLYFVSKKGVPLRYMTPLKLDPALLEQPLYH